MIQPPRPHRDSTVLLRDGRRLAFAEFGYAGGDPVFWFHGTPGARLQLPPDAPAVARHRGFRIIGVDRPGVGHSSHEPKRTLLGWADDIAQLADALGLDRFAVIGLSGGGPYVLSCAHELGDRVVVGVSLGGIAPLTGEHDAPPFNRILRRLMSMIVPVRRPLSMALSLAVQPLRPLVSQGYDLYVRFGPQEDRTVFEQPEIKAMFSEDIVMATRYGLRGPVYDLSLFAQPWGFSPRDIRVPIRIWHGDSDTIVPLHHSEYLNRIIPDCEMTVMEGLGHFAGFCSASEVLSEIDRLWHDRHVRLRVV